MAAALLWCAFLAVATAAEPAPEDLGRLAAQQQALRTLSGTFTWSVARGDEVRRQVGAFALDRTGPHLRYEVRLSQPDGSELTRWCSDGTGAWQVEQLLEGEPPDVRTGEHPDLRRVIACLLLDLPVLEQDFTLAYAPEAGLLTLRPRTPDLARALTEVRVRLEGTRPVRVELLDPQDGAVVVEVQEVQRDQPVDERRFRLR